MNLIDILELNKEFAPLVEFEKSFPKISRESLFEGGDSSVARLEGMLFPRSALDQMLAEDMEPIVRLDHSCLLTDEEYEKIGTIVTPPLLPWLLIARVYVMRAIIRAHVAGEIPYENMRGFASFRLHAVTTPGFDQLEILRRPLQLAHANFFPNASTPQMSIVGVVSLMYRAPLMLDARLNIDKEDTSDHA